VLFSKKHKKSGFLRVSYKGFPFEMLAIHGVWYYNYPVLLCTCGFAPAGAFSRSSKLPGAMVFRTPNPVLKKEEKANECQNSRSDKPDPGGISGAGGVEGGR